MEYRFKGLTDQEVEHSRKLNGSNAVTPPEVETFWDKLKDNFKDPMIVILVVALVIIVILAATGFAEWYEGVGIAAAVALATLVSTWSEHKNEQAFQKLQEEASRIKVNVFRNNRVTVIDLDDVVTGDMILLQPGDKIAADGKLVAGELKINQALLTGEPEPVTKKSCSPEAVFEDLRELENPHLLFRGTTVGDGEGVMEVLTVGDHSLYGKLAQELQPQDRDGPLRIKLKKLAQDIARFGYIGATFIALSFLFKQIFMDHHFDMGEIAAYMSQWQVFLYDIATAAILAVIIIVVAVPEGLPMMVAIVLAQNMRRLLDANVLVRQLLGIETAGSLNLLFSDKTGTITKGQLEGVRFITGPAQDYPDFQSLPPKLRFLLDTALRENTSCVIDPHAPPEQRIIGGNTTERALMKFIGAHHEPRESDSKPELVRTILFNSSRKFSAAQIRHAELGEITLVKGVPERILEHCDTYYDDHGDPLPLSEDMKDKLTDNLEKLSEAALRLLAIATSKTPAEENEHLPVPLTLIGFVGIRDEIRPESKPAIERVQEAGVHVVMITGDKKETATAIAREAGLIASPDDEVIVSKELEAMSDQELKSRLPRLKVIARSLPSDKSRLVQAAQEVGQVVGMTGDGVNDAPALNKADIGFGMGSGSEVAKEASRIVILDDNFSSISQAILYGRTIYHSIQKFINYQLTVNVSAILVAFLGPFLGFRLPLTMTQLLWVNLIMDTLAALSFSGEPPVPEYMKEKPKDREESIINKDMWSSILLTGGFIALMCVVFLKSSTIRGWFATEESYMSAFFAFFVIINTLNQFNCRVPHLNLLAHIWENKGFLRVVGIIIGVQIVLTHAGGVVGDVFRTTGLSPAEWAWVALLSFTIIPFGLARKAVRDGLGG